MQDCVHWPPADRLRVERVAVQLQRVQPRPWDVLAESYGVRSAQTYPHNPADALKAEENFLY